MTPAQIRQQAATLRRDPSAVLREYDEQFFLHPGFIEGLARQLEEEAHQKALLLREMGENDLETTLNDSLQAIRGIHGDETFDRVIQIANGISNEIDLTTDPERYISELRQDAEVYQGAMHSALINLADDLETTHLQDWEPELAPHERPLQTFAPRGTDPNEYRDYYTAEATGSTRAFDQIMQAERMTPGAIQEAIARTDGRAMYEPDVMQFYGVDSPAGVSQINNALRRYVEGRGPIDIFDEANHPQLPAPARVALGPPAEEDVLPPIRQRPMGVNFFSDAVDEFLDSNHIDALMEMYREIGDQVEDLGDRTNQQTILRLIREYSDQLNEMGDGDAGLAGHELADRFRDMIIEASRPEGHATGGLIQSFESGGKVDLLSEFDKALNQPGLKHKFTEQDLLSNYGDSVFESFDKAKARKRLEPVALKHATYVDNFDDGVSLLRRNSVPLGKANPEIEQSGKPMEDYNRQHMPLQKPSEQMNRGTPVYKKGGAAAHKPVYFAETPDAMRYELLRNK